MSSMCHLFPEKAVKNLILYSIGSLQQKGKKNNHILNLNEKYENNDTHKNKNYTYFSATYQICLPIKKKESNT